MASLLNDPLLEISGQAPSPNNNFYHFSITKSQVIWRWWTISIRAVDRYTRPGETKMSHQEMLEDFSFQGEISTIFGKDVLEDAKSLCHGHFNYLGNLPTPLLLKIMGFLELEDVGQLLRTSHRFWKLCQSEEFWETTVRHEAVTLAQHIGWRRIFFTNKIHLQLLINRHSMKAVQKDSLKQPVDESTGGNEEQTESRIGVRDDKKPFNASSPLSLSTTSDHSSSPYPTSEPSFSPRPPSDPVSSSEDEPQCLVKKEFSGRLRKYRQAHSDSRGDDEVLNQPNENLQNVLSRPNSDMIFSFEDKSQSPVMREFSETLRKHRLAQRSNPGDGVLSPLSEDNCQSSVVEELMESSKKSLTSTPSVLTSSSEDKPRSSHLYSLSESAEECINNPTSSSEDESLSSKMSEYFQRYGLAQRSNSDDDSPPLALTSSSEEEPQYSSLKELMERFRLAQSTNPDGKSEDSESENEGIV